MPKFKAKTTIVLKCDPKGSNLWLLKIGRDVKTWARGFYLVWQKTYRAMADKKFITKIEITITREK